LKRLKTFCAHGVENLHHPDRLGTRLVTDASSGTVVTEQLSMPFGTMLPFTQTYGGENSYQNPTLSNPSKKRFASYDRSDVTTLDYAVNRFYSSQQGRFTQVDPSEMDAASLSNPQTLNLYAYCGNDPINQIDPNGLFFGWLKSLFGAIGKFFSSTVGKIVAVVALTVLSLGLLGPLAAQSVVGSFSIGGGATAAVVGATHLTLLGWATVGVSLLSGVSLPGDFGTYGGFRTPNTFPDGTGVGAISGFQRRRRAGTGRQRAEWIEQIKRTIEFQKEVIDLFKKYGPKFKYSLALVDKVKADIREKYGEIRAAGVTDHLGYSTINDDEENPYIKESTRIHERVHRRTLLAGIKKYGGTRTPEYVEWYIDAQRWADDEVKAYSAGIEYLERTLRKLK
jgi:RHS repeat-associated protein